MALSRDVFNMIKPSRTVAGFDQYGNWVEKQVAGETYEEYLARTGQKEGPSISSQVMAGVIGGVAGYQLAKRHREKSKREKEDELEQQRLAEIRRAQSERLKSDRELIKKRAIEQVRLETVRNYDYHEMMTHYFLGIDAHDRPFDIDKYGIPYYLDVDTLSYNYYTKDTLDPIAMTYSDAKRQRLGLRSLADLPMSSWVYGETINNNPRNLDNILAEEAQIKAQLEQYRAAVEVKEQLVRDAERVQRDQKQKDDDEYSL